MRHPSQGDIVATGGVLPIVSLTMTEIPSPVRPRVSGRDIVPILASGLILTGATVAVHRSLLARDIAVDCAISIAFMLAVAGIQGRAEGLTPRGAVTGWLKLAFIATVVILATGRLTASGMLLRLAVFLVASLGASLLLYFLRTRRR